MESLIMIDLLEQIDQYSRLKEGWDGYGGEPPNRYTLDNAREFIEEINEADIGLAEPELSLLPHGTIQFEWENYNGHAWLEIGQTRYSAGIHFYGRVEMLDGRTNDYSKIITALSKKQ